MAFKRLKFALDANSTWLTLCAVIVLGGRCIAQCVSLRPMQPSRCIGCRFVLIFFVWSYPDFNLLQRWTGQYFTGTSLQKLGLKVHLGHGGGPCPSATAEISNFVVVDTSGQHTITMSFCECLGAPPCRIQLLRVSWFPATLLRPQTAYTFDVLNSFQLVNLQGKLSAYDYYLSLMHKTNNVGVSDLKVRVFIPMFGTLLDNRLVGSLRSVSARYPNL